MRDAETDDRRVDRLRNVKVLKKLVDDRRIEFLTSALRKRWYQPFA